MARKKDGSIMTPVQHQRMLLYSRVSSQGPSLEYASMNDQKKAIERLCAGRGWYMVSENDARKVEE